MIFWKWLIWSKISCSGRGVQEQCRQEWLPIFFVASIFAKLFLKAKKFPYRLVVFVA